MASDLQAMADEINAIALAYEAVRTSPVRHNDMTDRLRHLRDMIENFRIEHLQATH
jgi:hypothetical protein